MKIHRLHGWEISISEARALQSALASKVESNGQLNNPSFIAGLDVSSNGPRGTAQAAIVVLAYPSLEAVEVRIARGKLLIPYIPGLLSFREMPLLLDACRKLQHAPSLVLVDGQGIAHPRRLGLASHLGLFLNIPTIGCAKSILCGRHAPLGETAGAYAELTDKGEVIGAALRTRTGIKPVYISIGHKIALAEALYWVLKCCRRYRLPEPVRLAHLAAGGKSDFPPPRRRQAN
jgi:deoxyribonuclease V